MQTPVKPRSPATQVRGELVLGDFHPHLETAFARRLRELAPRGDARGLLVVVPNRFVAVHLPRRAAELGVPTLGLRPRALEDLIWELARPGMEGEGWKPLAGWQGPFLVAEVLRPVLARRAETGGSYFARAARHGGLYRVLEATFRDLRDALVGPEDLAEAAGRVFPGDPKLAELVELYRLYVRMLGERRLADGAAVAEWACRALDEGEGLEARALLIYGIYDLVARQRRFLGTLLRAAGEAQVFFPWGEVAAGEAPGEWEGRGPFAYARPAKEWFAAQGLVEVPADLQVGGARATQMPADSADAEPLDASCLRRLRRRVFWGRPPEKTVFPNDRTVRFLSTPTPARQALEVLRLLAADPGRSAGVLLRQEAEEAPLYLQLRRQTGIPLHLPAGQPWSRTAAGRVVLSLLRLAAGRRQKGDGDGETFSRAEVEDLLSSPALNPELFPQGAHPARWPQLLRWLGLTTGLSGWQHLVARHAASEESAPAGGDEDDEEHRDLDPALRAELPFLARWAEDLLETTESLAREFPSWRAFGERLAGILERWLAPGETRHALLSHLSSLAELDGVLTPAFPGALEATEALLSDRRPAPYGLGAAPTVADLMTLRGVTFDRVLLPSLTEKVFPRRARQDPVLLDGEREALNRAWAQAGRDLRLPVKQADAAAEERLLFRLAVGSVRTELLLLWPRLGEDGRTLVPSTFLLEALGLLRGREVDFEDLVRPGGAPPVELVPLSPSYPPEGAGPPLLPSEFDLREIDQTRRLPRGKGEEALSYLLDAYPRFAQSVRMDWKRNNFATRRLLTEYDGLVGPRLGRAWLREHRLGGPQGPVRTSASRLEAYARCSFHFFHRFVLGLRSEPPPEARLDLDPRQVGSLYHEALRRLFLRLKAQGLLPLSVETLAAAQAQVEPAVQELLAAAPSWLTKGPQALWENRRRRLVRDLGRLLELEAERAGDGWWPASYELAFGRDGDPAVIQVGEARLALSGRIDRVDRRPGGWRIVDYKTGALKSFRSAKTPEDKLQGGEALQLPLYRLALGEIKDLPPEEEIWGLYQGVESWSGYREVTWSPEEFQQAEVPVAEIVQGILVGMARGEFYQVERGRYCDFHCPFGSICGPGRAALIATKSQDPKTAAAAWRGGEFASGEADAGERTDG